jgi:pyruvate dehydrogenase E1 component alpha subunit
MITNHTVESLRAFEESVAADFNAARIRSPIHLAGGNEQALLDIFADVREQDWCAVSWRSHYHCLLKGVPPEELRAAILKGHSIALNFPARRVISSAIVGGVLPIALGIAWAIKRAGKDERCWAFLGDMTSRTGIYHECWNYARGHCLPITFVVEDNGLSVCTDTRKTWDDGCEGSDARLTRRYEYVLPFPHSGAGKRVDF